MTMSLARRIVVTGCGGSRSDRSPSAPTPYPKVTRGVQDVRSVSVTGDEDKGGTGCCRGEGGSWQDSLSAQNE